MNKEKLKIIIRNLESLVNCLKEEINSDEYLNKEETPSEESIFRIEDYDEIFYDDDRYSD